MGPQLENHQGRHAAILGETGMGKSSLLVAIALRAVRLGGILLLDPIGDTARFVREQIPPKDRSRVRWISAAEGRPSLNALEGIEPGAPPDALLGERRLNDLVHALRRVRAHRYSDVPYWGPRLEEVLVRALRAAAALERGTLAEAHSLLATGARAPRPTRAAAGQLVRELADRIRERPDDAEGARRLLYEVVRSSVLTRMVCDPDPEVHADELVAEDRIVLVSGDAERVGETTARYLLSIYLALAWSELLARSSVTKWFVLLDEAQWFAHESLAEMLRLSRRRNVHVVLATQSIASLSETVQDAVWTNVADFVSFRGSPEEAREFSRIAPGVRPEEILSLPRGFAILLRGKGGRADRIRTARRPMRALPGTAAGDPPTSGGSALAGPGEGEEPRVSAVLRWLREQVPSEEDGELHISLAELRRRVDPEGGSVRLAGAILGRAGALRGTDRRSDGAWWHIDPDRIPLDPPARPAPRDPPHAVPPQPS